MFEKANVLFSQEAHRIYSCLKLIKWYNLRRTENFSVACSLFFKTMSCSHAISSSRDGCHYKSWWHHRSLCSFQIPIYFYFLSEKNMYWREILNENDTLRENRGKYKTQLEDWQIYLQLKYLKSIKILELILLLSLRICISSWICII